VIDPRYQRKLGKIFGTRAVVLPGRSNGASGEDKKKNVNKLAGDGEAVVVSTREGGHLLRKAHHKGKRASGRKRRTAYLGVKIRGRRGEHIRWRKGSKADSEDTY